MEIILFSTDDNIITQLAPERTFAQCAYNISVQKKIWDYHYVTPLVIDH
jgi:hypothetical protein